MLNEAKSALPWDLADPRTMRSNFSSKSFYIVIDGVDSKAVRAAGVTIKTALKRCKGVHITGPIAMPTERRRNVILREVRSSTPGGLYCANAKRVRNVLLVKQPSAEAIASLISLVLPATVNLKIEPFETTNDVKDGI